MKVGIITFHCSYNYGSALQAFALQKYINDHFCQAQVIDYIQPEDFKQYRLFRWHRYLASPKAFVGDLLYFFPNYKRKTNFSSFLRKFVSLTPRRYNGNKNLTQLNTQFDAFICGSDQIWNPVCTNGIEPSYYLAFAAPGKKKIAYACSMGHSEIEPIYQEEVAHYLQQLDWISVREKTAQNHLQPLTCKKISVVLDPTMLPDKQIYMDMLPPQAEIGHIFVYMLEENNVLISYAAALAESTGKKIIYISKNYQKEYKNARNVYGISPDRFLRYLKDADYVVTNSFHATVFSILFRKQFCTFRTRKSFSRMEDLLTMLGISDRLYCEGFDINAFIDYETVEKRLSEKRDESVHFLTEALK